MIPTGALPLFHIFEKKPFTGELNVRSSKSCNILHGITHNYKKKTLEVKGIK